MIPEPVLFLCRTPFQALLISRIIERERVERYDIAYYNPQLSSYDRAYFARLAERAGQSMLFSRRSMCGWLRFIRLACCPHGSIMLGNHTFSFNRLVVHRKARSRIFTFDEGAGNFDQSGGLHQDTRSRLERTRDFLMGAPPMQAIFARSERHYTIDPSLPNIVPANRLVGVGFGDAGTGHSDADPVNILIGQPFSEYLDAMQTALLHDAFALVPMARYVPHPREKRDAIPPTYPLLLSDEKVLEEVVMEFRANGHSVRLIGGFTTALASIRGGGVTRYYLDVAADDNRSALMRSIGCEIFDLRTEEGRQAWADLCSTWR